MYSILDICDTHAVSQLHVVLSQGVKEVFKMLYADYLKYHHYTGKVWSALLSEAIQLGPCFIVSILCKWYMYSYGCNKHTAYTFFLFVVTGNTVHSKGWFRLTKLVLQWLQRDIHCFINPTRTCYCPPCVFKFLSFLLNRAELFCNISMESPVMATECGDPSDENLSKRTGKSHVQRLSH